MLNCSASSAFAHEMLRTWPVLRALFLPLPLPRLFDRVEPIMHNPHRPVQLRLPLLKFDGLPLRSFPTRRMTAQSNETCVRNVRAAATAEQLCERAANAEIKNGVCSTTRRFASTALIKFGKFGTCQTSNVTHTSHSRLLKEKALRSSCRRRRTTLALFWSAPASAALARKVCSADLRRSTSRRVTTCPKSRRAATSTLRFGFNFLNVDLRCVARGSKRRRCPWPSWSGWRTQSRLTRSPSKLSATPNSFANSERLSTGPLRFFVRELAAAYPNAKIVLTMRSNDKQWFDSANNTIFQFKRSLSVSIVKWHRRALWRVGLAKNRDLIRDMIDAMWKCVDETGRFGEDEMRAYYRRWQKRVESYFEPERLLVFQVADGYAPLCKLIDVPKPADTDSLPHVNTSQAKRRQLTQYKRTAAKYVVADVVVVSALAGAGFLIWKALQNKA